MVSTRDVLILAQAPNIGPARLRLLISRFGDSSAVFSATAREVATVEGFSKKLAAHVVHFLRSMACEEAKRFADRQLSRLNAINGEIITLWDKRYPDPLRKIYDPPPYLYLSGRFAAQDRSSVAIVGTRDPTAYGQAIAEQFASDLARLGIPVVSGLARGIDTIAHCAALNAGGRTIAVIGSGLDVIYPPENKPLAARIHERGAVVSEFAMGVKPDAGNFPRRNRIISGLTLGTLVIETDVGGGAMITASTALDQNREVFAIPGLVSNRKSKGCHALIREGRAKLVESIDDILAEIGNRLDPAVRERCTPRREVPVELSLFEKSIYDLLGETPCHIDAIAERAGASTSDVLVHLLSLEFMNLVRQLPGKFFIRAGF